MIDCQTARTELHVEPAAPLVGAHLASCAGCAAYAARFARLDQVLRGERLWEAPAALDLRLETLAPSTAPVLSRVETMVRTELVCEAPEPLTRRLHALVAEPTTARRQTPVDRALRAALVVEAPRDLTARLQTLTPQAAPVAARPRPRPWVVAAVYFITSALLLLSLFYVGQIYSLVIAQFGLEAWLQEIAAYPAVLLEQLYAAVPQSRLVVSTFVRAQQPLQWMLVTLILWAVIDMSQRQRERARQYA